MIYKANYNALLPEPKVIKPRAKDYSPEEGEYWSDRAWNEAGNDYEEAVDAYNKWLSSQIPVVGEHKWVDGQKVVEGVDYELKERWKPLNPQDERRVYEVIYVAIPIKEIMNQAIELERRYEDAQSRCGHACSIEDFTKDGRCGKNECYYEASQTTSSTPVASHSSTVGNSNRNPATVLYEVKELIGCHYYAARNDKDYPMESDKEEINIAINKLQSLLTNQSK